MVAREVFRYCETKKIEGKPWYAWKFPRSQVFWNLEVVTTNFFGFVRQRNFGRKTWFSVPMHRKFRYPKLSGRLKALPTKFFSTVRPKKINGESRYPLLKNFRCPKDSERQRWSPTNFIGSKRGIYSTQKSDITLLGMKFFGSRTFLIYRSVPQRNLSALWADKFSMESWFSVLFQIFFRYLTFEIFETLDGYSRSFSVLWDKKKSKENRDTHESFRNPKFSET